MGVYSIIHFHSSFCTLFHPESSNVPSCYHSHAGQACLDTLSLPPSDTSFSVPVYLTHIHGNGDPMRELNIHEQEMVSDSDSVPRQPVLHGYGSEREVRCREDETYRHSILLGERARGRGKSNDRVLGNSVCTPMC